MFGWWTNSRMAGVQLEFSPLLAEWDELRNLTYDFVDTHGAYGILQSKQTLRNIQDSEVDVPRRWALDPGNAIRTIRRDGVFEPASEKHGQVWATLSFSWEITRRFGPQGTKTHFEITGEASTVIRICTDVGGKEVQLAMWRMETGAEDGPGAAFYARIMGEKAAGQFPKSLPIPRLPIFPTTPASALEFVIAELFQDTWLQHLGATSQRWHTWKTIQSDRLRNYHEWSLDTLRTRRGSPITDLKQSFPEPDRFLSG